MPKTVILGSARTPIGKLGGGLAAFPATELGGLAIAAALERAQVAPEAIQHVVWAGPRRAGQIPPARPGSTPASPKEVSSRRSTRCASGVSAVGMLDASIRCGDVEIAVGAGVDVERALSLPQARFGYRMGDAKMLDAMIKGRPDQPVQRQADVRRGDRGQRRAQDDPCGPRPLSAALARACRPRPDEGRLPERRSWR